MVESLADGALLAGPPALACAAAVVADRVRARRRRDLVNRAMHELRRPLQALVLQANGPAHRWGERDQLAQALAALSELDRAVNGEAAPPTWTVADGESLAGDAARRWRGPASLKGRPLVFAWRADGSRIHCDATAVSRALDNLIANSLEHGSGPIRIEGVERAGRLRLTVADGTAAGGEPPRGPVGAARTAGPRQGRDRRGHGLRIVTEVAAAHGGRFAACSHSGGTSAVLELPVVSEVSARDAA